MLRILDEMKLFGKNTLEIFIDHGFDIVDEEEDDEEDDDEDTSLIPYVPPHENYSSDGEDDRIVLDGVGIVLEGYEVNR